MTPELMLSAGALFVAAVVWLVRLEGRVNAAKAETEAVKLDLISVKAKADAEASSHSETILALVRVQEQLKHLTSLFESQFRAAPRSRAAPK